MKKGEKIDRNTFKIEGIKPYIFSQPIEGQKVPKTDAQKTKCALERVYTNDKGVYAPARQLKGVIKSGATLQKMKLEKSSVRFMDYLKATVDVDPEIVYFYHGGQKPATVKDLVMIDYPVKTDQGKIVWTRSAMLPLPWTMEFDVIIRLDVLEMPAIIEALKAGGSLKGMGGKRPDYGLFEVNGIKK